MNSILDKLFDLLYLIIGIVIGFYFQKEKLKKEIIGMKDHIITTFIKPTGSVIDSKEENSLNKMTDEVNYHHNDHFDEQGRS